MKTFKLKGLNYFAVDCRDINHALIIFLHNRCGVTLKNIEEVEIDSFPEGSKIFYSH